MSIQHLTAILAENAISKAKIIRNLGYLVGSQVMTVVEEWKTGLNDLVWTNLTERSMKFTIRLNRFISPAPEEQDPRYAQCSIP